MVEQKNPITLFPQALADGFNNLFAQMSIGGQSLLSAQAQSVQQLNTGLQQAQANALNSFNSVVGGLGDAMAKPLTALPPLPGVQPPSGNGQQPQVNAPMAFPPPLPPPPFFPFPQQSPASQQPQNAVAQGGAPAPQAKQEVLGTIDNKPAQGTSGHYHANNGSPGKNVDQYYKKIMSGVNDYDAATAAGLQAHPVGKGPATEKKPMTQFW